MVSMVERLVFVVVYPLVGWLGERSLTAAVFSVGGGILVVVLLSQVREQHLRD